MYLLQIGRICLLFSGSVGQSLIKTRHKALIVNANGEPDISTVRAPRIFIRLWDYTALLSCLLRQAFANYNWSGFTNAIDARSGIID